MGDDGVGWVIAQKLKDEFIACEDLEFEFLSLGGLSLMERLTNYSDVIIIDAFATGDQIEGEIISFKFDECPDFSAGHSTSAHDTSLHNALVIARSMNIPLPLDEKIQIVAVKVQINYEFSDVLTPIIERSVNSAVDLVKMKINTWNKERNNAGNGDLSPI